MSTHDSLSVPPNEIPITKQLYNLGYRVYKLESYAFNPYSCETPDKVTLSTAFTDSEAWLICAQDYMSKLALPVNPTQQNSFNPTPEPIPNLLQSPMQYIADNGVLMFIGYFVLHRAVMVKARDDSWLLHTADELERWVDNAAKHLPQWAKVNLGEAE